MGDTLKQYGHSFQAKTIAALITDKIFLNQIYDILLPEYFDSKSLNFLCKSTFEYYQEYKKVPSIDVYKVQISNLPNELDRVEAITAIKEVWREIGSDDLTFIKKETHKFCQNQELKKAILASVDLLKEGKFDEIKHSIDSALKKGMDSNLGMDYLNEVDERYEVESVGKRVKTGWQIIDDITGGGIPAGKLCVWIGGPGSTKTTHLVHIGATALKNGLNILHYTLELDENYVGMKYDAVMTGICLDDLKYHMDDVKKRLKPYKDKGHLIIKKFPTKGISLQGLKAHIDKTIMIAGRSPDLIILDYADLLKLRTSSALRKDELLQELYEELVGMADELQIPIHTASQVNRSKPDGGKKQRLEIIEGDRISESYGKMFTADVVISISRTAADKVNGTGRLHIIKNRLGRDGMTFPESIDTSKGKIEIFDERTDEGQDTKDKMISDGDYDRQQLSILYDRTQKQQQLNGGF